MSGEPSASATSGASAEAICARGFAFSYPDGAPVFEGVSMDVREGAFAILCGPTGCGKTTLLRCMVPSLRPVGTRVGSMRVFGEECPSPFDVGFVFQDPDAQIVCDTVWREMAFGLENMGMERGEMRLRIAEVATVFGVDAWFDARTDELSGGQKQMLNLASVIAMRPRLLLLDEPTAQLDPVSARRLLDALRLANCELGMTVVVATHSPEMFADQASQAYRLHDGRLLCAPLESLRFRQEVAPAYQPMRIGAESSTLVAAKDAWFSYAHDAKPVLRGLDFEAREGEVVALVGSNGSGKTTLLKLLAGILAPQRGNVSRPNQTQAYLPQDPRLLLECFDDIDALDMSGGEQQMVALSKLLAAHPRLLLLDEPAKGLDADAQMALAEAFRDAASCGASVVLATHDLSFASRVADRIAMLFDGAIAHSAPARDFCEGNAYYRPHANAFTNAWDARHAEEAACE